MRLQKKKHFVLRIVSSSVIRTRSINGIDRSLSLLGGIRRDGIPYFITAPSLTEAASENKFFFPRFTSTGPSYLGDIRFRISFSRGGAISSFRRFCRRKRRAAGDSCREFFHVPTCCTTCSLEHEHRTQAGPMIKKIIFSIITIGDVTK